MTDQPLTRAEVLVVLACSLVLAAAMRLNLVLHITTHLSEAFLVDTPMQAWILSWGGHALATQPSRFFESNAFWPTTSSLAMVESTPGWAPLALIGSSADAAILRHNVVILIAATSALVGAYLLARELGLVRIASGIAGAVYAYAPFRGAHHSHLHVVASGGIPLALFLLVRGYRRRSPPMILAGWLVVLWQLSVSLSLGLMLLYLVAALGIVLLVAWVRGYRPRLEKAVIWATILGVTVLIAGAFILVRPYLEIQRAYPTAERTAEEVLLYSPPVRALFAAPVENVVWGGSTANIRNALSAGQEQAIFPGLAVIVLFVVGLRTSTFAPPLRYGLCAATVATTVFALGLRGPLDGRFTYELLRLHAPGWATLRTPGRLMTLAMLGAGLVAAAAAQALALRFATRDRRASMNGRLLFVVLALVLLEGASVVPARRVPEVPAGLETAGEPQLHLPMSMAQDGLYMLWSADVGFPLMANGYGSFETDEQSAFQMAARGFPDARSIAALRALGIRSVVLHEPLLRGSSWEGADRKSVDGLPVTRTDHGEAIVFTLPPA